MTKHQQPQQPLQQSMDAIWQGRVDSEDGDNGRRFHQMVNLIDLSKETLAPPAGLLLLGFCCDEGVRRNKGRVGAFQAPNLIRAALANMAWHHGNKQQATPLYDAGNTCCIDDQLEKSQLQLAQQVCTALQQKHKVMVFGGGHELAWASFQGLSQYFQKTGIHNPKIGIINFDAHFDLRRYSINNSENNSTANSDSDSSSESYYPTSSGTPFKQIADRCLSLGWAFNYACLGVSRASNTQALFNQADQLNVLYREDKQLATHLLTERLAELTAFISKVDHLYLTIDIDVFSASIAPGVSAPAPRGISYETIEILLQPILDAKNQAGKSKLILADFAEYNPEFDSDKQTARLVARLAWDISKSMLSVE